MPTYKCNNEECASFGVHSHVGSTKIVVRGYQIVDIKAECPDCGKERQNIKEDGFTTKIHGGPNIPIT